MRSTILTAAVALFALAGCGGGKTPAATGGAWAAESSHRQAANASLSAELDPAQHVDGAYQFCVQQLSDQLKAPATAKFSTQAASHPTRNGAHLLFSGTVDSENSFSALIRSTWECDILWTGNSYIASRAVVHDGG